MSHSLISFLSGNFYFVLIKSSLEYRYVEHANRDCVTGHHYRQIHDLELCKEYCADDASSGGIVLGTGCFVKGLNFEDNLVVFGATTYIKIK